MKNWTKHLLVALGFMMAVTAQARPKDVDKNTVLATFHEYLQKQSYYADDKIEAQREKVNGYVDAINHMENPGQYVQDNQLNGYVRDAEDSIKKYRDDARRFVTDFFALNYPESKFKVTDKQACMDSMNQVIEARLAIRESNIKPLRDAVNKYNAQKKEGSGSSSGGILTIVLIAVGALVLILVVMMLVRRGKNKPKKPRKPANGTSDKDRKKAEGDIVVRRKTMTILKKQTLEDVVDNPAYLKIDCSQISNDCAVRYLYLKNTCVREIYDMYEADLKQVGRPPEDGCMVLGRWVHDAEADEYYVSMEHVVMPGDDAVFKEYELNFGGKIKMRMAETLRRLRRDTNLQYDLTCWVHSHPGLGVFFSNADSSVHLQLKHPTHPRFLMAFVIDILTPDQDLGIFTFRRDQSINAKPDLKKMFSLIDLNAWAVESMKAPASHTPSESSSGSASHLAPTNPIFSE